MRFIKNDFRQAFYDINCYSTNAKTFSGSGLLSSIKIIEIAPFTRYSLSGSYFHYALMPPIWKSTDGAATD
jgi:hypothetical protein